MLHWRGSAIVLVALACAMSARGEIRFNEAFRSVETYSSETRHSLGIIWFDFDNDGDPDLMATDGFGRGGPHLYRNDGNVLTPVDHYLPVLPDYELVGLIYSDYDRDGDVDVYIYTANEDWTVGELNNPPDGPPNLLLQNQLIENGGLLAEPQFVEVAAAAGVDDCPDVPFGDYPCFQTRTANWLDYDVDGCVDLFVGHLVPNEPGEPWNRDRLYRNQCDGTFVDVTDSSGLDTGSANWRGALTSLAADLNNDGFPDLYVGNIAMHESIPQEDYNDQLFMNRGDGSFVEVFAGTFDDTPAAMGIDIADVNLDGQWDLYVTDMYKHVFVTHDDGNTLYGHSKKSVGFSNNIAALAGVEGFFSWGTNFLDADQDGDSDLFVGVSLFAGPYSDPPGHEFSEIYESPGIKAPYVPVGLSAGLTTIDARGSALADYDGDGDIDIAVVNQDGPLQVFRNDTINAGNSLKVRLTPSVTNPDCFGTTVFVNVGGRVLMRQVKGGSSAHSQDYGELHFGLGEATVADRVTVAWPGGAVQHLLEVPAGTIIVAEP